jgi:hypothetical protein
MLAWVLFGDDEHPAREPKIRRLQEQADGCGRRRTSYRQFLKRTKARTERRRARLNPECLPAYGRYHGWQS